jgi:metal-dependent hydrolase (beta-lactamase superfamily II)/creatinine amidohydrolase/Fe(II)-dependent formamide hydrolase-like protein
MRHLSASIFLAICLTAISYGQPAFPGPINLPVLPSVNVTVLVENMAGGGPVLGEWGLAYLIETGRHRILFDTGSGFTLPGNARTLEVDLAKIDAIVISHGHIDHTGGLVKELETCGPVDLFIHPAAFVARYYKEGLRFIKGGGSLSAADVRRRVRALHETIKPTEIGGGLMVTGEVPRVTDFEDTGLRGDVFMDPDGKTEDLVRDDQAIFFRVPEGVVILLGCAHAGVVNTIQYVSKLTGETRIYAVMGGTHLITASPARMKKTVEAFRRFGLEKIMLSHCTGVDAYAEVARAFPGRCSWPAAGAQVRFGGQRPETAADREDLSATGRQAIKTIRMEEMPWPEIKRAIDSGYTTAVFAVGSTEQHGPHLPEMTDARIGDDVGERVARKLGRALQARTIDVGVSDHHLMFAGTISLKPETLSLVLRDYVDSLVRHGFKRIVIVPTHGGNFATVEQAIGAARIKHPGVETVGFTDVLALVNFLGRISVQNGISAEEGGSHAGESETSMMLTLEADLVATGNFAPGYLGPFGEAETKLLFEKGMRALSSNGVLGDPRKASAARGEVYLEAFADFIVSKIKAKSVH